MTDPIAFIQGFIEGLILVFKGIAELIMSSLAPFDGKGPFSNIPGLRIPVCFLNPFFVIAFMIVPGIKKYIIGMLMPSTYPLRYGRFMLGKRDNERWKDINKETEDFIQEKLTILLWVIFFMFALAFIFLPPIFGKIMISLPQILNLVIPTLFSVFLIPVLLLTLRRYINIYILILTGLVAIRYTWRGIYQAISIARKKIGNKGGPAGESPNPILDKAQKMFDKTLSRVPGAFAYFSYHRVRTLGPQSDAAPPRYIENIVRSLGCCNIPEGEEPKNNDDWLLRNIKSMLNDLEIGYRHPITKKLDNNELAHTIYIIVFYIWRLMLIPGIVLYAITSLIRLDRTVTTVVAAILAGLLAALMTITAVIMLPNPKCDPKMLGPIKKASNYITMVALPSFIIAWFFPELVEGCFDCFDGVNTVKKGFDKMMGGI